jgi:hypothetical protein
MIKNTQYKAKQTHTSKMNYLKCSPPRLTVSSSQSYAIPPEHRNMIMPKVIAFSSSLKDLLLPSTSFAQEQSQES